MTEKMVCHKGHITAVAVIGRKPPFFKYVANYTSKYARKVCNMQEVKSRFFWSQPPIPRPGATSVKSY